MAHDYAKRFFVAMLLPTKVDFSLDEDGIRRFTRYFLNSPFASRGGLIVNPEAGEVFYMSGEEKQRAIEIVLEEVDRKLPVFAGVYAPTTSELVESTRDAKDLGVDGIFVIPPGGAMDITYNWDPLRYPDVWLDQIKAQDRSVNLPILTHPIGPPSPKYGIGLPAETAVHICNAVPNIIGWKMTYSYDGYRRIARALRDSRPEVGLMGAAAHFFHENLASSQMDGTVCGAWCYALEPMLAHIEAWESGDLQKANAIWEGGLRQLQEWVYDEWGRLHIRYRLASWLRGLVDNPSMRPPLPSPTQLEVTTCLELLRRAGLSVRDDLDKQLVRFGWTVAASVQ
ncbi:Dihydrodipicolinate synthase/N-acetylneuraminate lyase [Burkholderia sp. CF099]|nr:Dihydrodipicolinate synthase/N-acetylneuraminate lyase [Burkholderia sp. CF099]